MIRTSNFVNKKAPALLQGLLYRVRDSNPYRLREREVS